MRSKSFRLRQICAAIVAISLFTGACQWAAQLSRSEPQKTAEPGMPTSKPQVPETEAVATEASSAPVPATLPPGGGTVEEISFAQYKEPAVQVEPSISHEPIAPDLSNVVNPFVLSPEQVERLVKDGFVVTPGNYKEFFMLYETGRYDNIPAFVTSDSLLHSYHLLFDKFLRTAEKEHFIPLLRDLNAALLKTADEQYKALIGQPWEEEARRVVAFVSVASRLLDPNVQVPEYVSDLVDQELALIDAAAGIQPSPIFPLLDNGEDYTQYIPRGHYTRSDELKAYFKSMMWYGRMTYRLKTENPETGRTETRSALLLANALRNATVQGQPAVKAWADLYSPTVFFVGRSDDLTVMQYLQVMDVVYGQDATLEKITDEARLDAFIEAADQLPPPRILGIVIGQDQDEEKTTKGMRFMGQRFVPDAYIFRQLIYRNVSTQTHRRGLPMGLDLMSAMGSERAYTILDGLGETGYERYPEQMTKVRTWLSGLSQEEWTETLYNSWLYTFYPLLEVPGDGYPAFMRSDAWLDKQLNTSLGSWAELKHDTILYAKQAYAELGGGPPPPEPVPPRGYVEPVPQFYARLAALTAMTHEGLKSRGLLSEIDEASLQRLEELARAFQIMAEKELRGEPLSAEELDTIRFYGGELEHLVMAAADKDVDTEDPFAQNYMEEEPQAAVIADVATDPDPNGDGSADPVVLEEGVGRINEIHAVVPIVQEDGSILLQVAKGGVFSYYEFPWPAEDRLTDEKWRTMLDEGQAPDLPEWTASFYIPQGEYSQLQRAIHQYEANVVYHYWDIGFLDISEAGMPEGSENLAPFHSELYQLKTEGHYVGHRLLQANFTSFDLQSEDRAVVTVRETWEDSLYEGQQPEEGQTPLAQREPYTLTSTYTLQRMVDDAGNTNWVVESVTFDSPTPEWK